MPNGTKENPDARWPIVVSALVGGAIGGAIGGYVGAQAGTNGGANAAEPPAIEQQQSPAPADNP